MPKLKPKLKIAENIPRWYITANVDLKTIKTGPYEDRDEAAIEAERNMKVGIWDDRRLYPPHAIIYIEVFEDVLK
jgi:hypothetical protein